MSKYKLAIREQDYLHNGTLGMRELLSCLVDSNLFEVSYHNARLKAMREFRATIIYFEGKKVYLDFWEYATPTHTTKVHDYNFDLIIKLQHRDLNPKRYQKYYGRKKMFVDLDNKQKIKFWNKIVPWTFFCSKMLKPYIGKEENLFCDEVKRDCFFCGKSWKCRSGITESLRNQGIQCLTSNQERRKGKKFDDGEYLKMMRESKYGLVLKGRSIRITDSKNRREIDYMMMKKPLLLNYKPYYYNKLEEGKHYIYLDEKTLVKDIEKEYNIKEIAENGYNWYLENASPMGAAKTFVKIMEEKL